MSALDVALQLVGLALFVVAAALVAVPLGLVVLGAVLLFVGFAVSKDPLPARPVAEVTTAEGEQL